MSRPGREPMTNGMRGAQLLSLVLMLSEHYIDR